MVFLQVLQHIAIGMLTFQIYVDASPRNTGKFQSIVTQEGPTLDSEIYSLQGNNRNGDLTKGKRQTRFNEYYGFAYSSSRPLTYASYSKRVESPYTGVYTTVGPHSQVHRSLKNIVDDVHPTQPALQLPSQNPYFDPAIFKSHCMCGTETNNTAQTNELNIQTIPNIHSRTFPDRKEETQKWGFVNERNKNINNEEDYSRPISFDPIRANKPLVRPAPAVEHGSIQAGTQGNVPTTTSNNIGRVTPYSDVDTVASMSSEVPSKCDRVLLSCCHMLEVTIDCFKSQGCSALTSNGNPCEPKEILRIIQKYQRVYV